MRQAISGDRAVLDYFEYLAHQIATGVLPDDVVLPIYARYAMSLVTRSGMGTHSRPSAWPGQLWGP